MKLTHSTLVATGLCLGAMTSAMASGLLSDDFNGTGLSTSWTIQRGWANVSAGFVDVYGSYGVGRDGFIAAGVGNDWSDYSINTRFIADGSPEDWYHAEVLFRVQDLHGWDKGSFYRLTVNTPLWPDPAGQGEVALLKSVNGVYSKPVSVFPGNVADRDNTLNIATSGGHISISINGTLVIDYTDPTPLLTGGVALGAIWESHTRYDYINVDGTGTPISLGPERLENPDHAVPEPRATLMVGAGLCAAMVLVRRHCLKERTN